MSVYHFLLVLIIGQSLLLVIGLVHRSSNHKFLIWAVSGLLIIESLILFDSVFLNTDAVLPWQFYLWGTLCVPAVAPLLLLVAHLYTRGHYQFRYIHLLHLIPFLFSLWVFADVYFLQSVQYKLNYIEWYRSFLSSKHNGYPLPQVLINAGVRMQLLGYAFVALNLLRKQSTKADLTFNTFSRRFFFLLFLGFGLMAVFNVVFGFLDEMGWFSLPYYHLLLQIGIGVHIMMLVYAHFGIKPVTESSSDEPETSEPKYSKSGLAAPVSAQYSTRLLQLMEKEEPFKDPLLSLPKLARLMGTNAHYLSQVINAEFGKSYHEFINEYRNRLACDMLTSPACGDLRIEEIGEACGYVSKSSFYRSFKVSYGVSPGAYRKQNQFMLIS